jgi:hypothetical protein
MTFYEDGLFPLLLRSSNSVSILIFMIFASEFLQRGFEFTLFTRRPHENHAFILLSGHGNNHAIILLLRAVI